MTSTTLFSDLEIELQELGKNTGDCFEIIVSTYPRKSGMTTAIANTVIQVLNNKHPNIKLSKSYNSIWLITDTYQLFQDYYEKFKDRKSLKVSFDKNGLIEKIINTRTGNTLYCFDFELPDLKELPPPSTIFIDKIEDKDGNFLSKIQVQNIFEKLNSDPYSKKSCNIFMSVPEYDKAEWIAPLIKKIQETNPYLIKNNETIN